MAPLIALESRLLNDELIIWSILYLMCDPVITKGPQALAPYVVKKIEGFF